MRPDLIYTGLVILLMSPACLRQPAKNKNIPAVYDEPVRTIICGNIPDANREVTMQVVDYARYLQTDYEKATLLLTTKSDNKGNYKFEITVKNPVYVTVYNYLVMPAMTKRLATALSGALTEPGDSLFVKSITESKKPFGYMEVSGKGSEKINVVLDVCRQLLPYLDNPDNNPEVSRNFRRFSLTDSINTKIVNTLKSYNVSATANTLLKAQLISAFTPDIGELTTKGPFGLDISKPEERIVAKERLGKINELIDSNDEVLIYSHDFFWQLLPLRIYLTACLENRVDSTAKFSYSDFKKENYDILLKYQPENRFKVRMLAAVLTFSSIYKFSDDVKYGMEDFLKRFPRNEFNAYYLDVFAENLKRHGMLQPGMPAFDFALRDTLDQMVKLKDLRGKVVLLDFMYTGCPGCVGMGRALEKIEPLYHGKDVEFLSISITKELEGTYGVKAGYGVACAKGSRLLYTNGEGSRHPIVSFYQVLGYPTLVLIDKKGNLVKVGITGDNDPRVDGGTALREMIDNELGK